MATRRSFLFSSLAFTGLSCMPSFAQSGSSLEVNVMSTGAVGNGQTLDTAAVQAAIDRVAAAGGGRVLIPGGKRFLIGGIALKSRVDLPLADDAILLASPDPAHTTHPDQPWELSMPIEQTAFASLAQDTLMAKG